MFFRNENTKSVNGNNPLGLTGSEILECFLYGLSAAVAVGFLVMVYGVYQYSHSNHTFAVQFEYKNESYSFLTKDAHSCDDLAKYFYPLSMKVGRRLHNFNLSENP